MIHFIEGLNIDGHYIKPSVQLLAILLLKGKFLMNICQLSTKSHIDITFNLFNS